jgi:signal transduction histidine kinase
MWSGLGAVYPAVGMLVASVLGFLYMLVQAYPLGDHMRFSGPSHGQLIHLILLCAFMFFFHMAFIGLIVARQNREQFLQLRRNSRLQTNIEKTKQKELLSTALAAERYHLLKMLTHEVRQPLNTAQAALQAVGDQLGRAQTAPETVQRNVANAQSTLNSIVLSISNSILGATLITEGRPIQLCPTDLCNVSQLALMDLDPLQRDRIYTRLEEPVIYTDADPIVLRLAIRNLLENALKYSPSNSSILFELVTDEEKLAVVIRVKNELIDPSMLNADIFQLNRRGVDSNYQGSGLGLYIVRKVAEMHKGDLGYRVVDGNQVVFELTIPA